MKLSRQGSMMSISLSNPYEGIARFMSDSEIEPRAIDPNDLKFDRDTIIQTIEDSLLTIPDLAREVQATNLDDDRTRHQTLHKIFEILRTKYSSPPKPPHHSTTPDSIDSLKFHIEQQQIGTNYPLTQN
jgi:hypothetical protein